MSLVFRVLQKCRKETLIPMSFMLVGAAHASTVTLPTDGSVGPLQGIITGFQAIISFLTGPIVTMVMTIACIVTVAIWMFIPKESFLLPFMRFMGGGMIILNIPGWIAFFQGFAS